MKEQLEHCISLCKDNAAWHRNAFKQTGDRYHLGQWKVYSRIAKRMSQTEYDKERSIQAPRDILHDSLI